MTRQYHLRMAVRPCLFMVLVVTLHSTHALETVLFADAVYWFSHHVKAAVDAPSVRKLMRREVKG